MRTLLDDIAVATADKAPVRRQPSAGGRRVAITIGVSCLAVFFSVWFVVRTFTGDERALVGAQAEERERQEALREQYPAPSEPAKPLPGSSASMGPN